MEKEKVLSGIYLKAVLPLLEEVVEYDETAAKLIRKWKASVMFHVSDGPAVTLKFRKGKVEVVPGKVALPTIAMWFTSAEKLNRMFAGENVIPVVWKGIRHVLLLKRFTQLTDRLNYYMQPTEEVVKDPKDKVFVVKLLMLAALRGAIEVAENDPHMAEIAETIPSGTIQMRILEGGSSAYVIQGEEGLSYGLGEAPVAPDAIMEFKNPDVALGVFQGTTDSMAALGAGDIRIRGLIPMVDNFNALLDGLTKYLDQ
ncbi:MAG TPA: hypothetical protein PLN69_11380 [bacterium]|nr:hypothetical protein [bacterium]